MSYTTRCPACGTMFRVVPDQLKISDGWVRCGHCADVFDATLYLEAWVPPPAPAQPPAPSRQDLTEAFQASPAPVFEAPGLNAAAVEQATLPEGAADVPTSTSTSTSTSSMAQGTLDAAHGRPHDTPQDAASVGSPLADLLSIDAADAVTVSRSDHAAASWDAPTQAPMAAEQSAAALTEDDADDDADDGWLVRPGAAMPSAPEPEPESVPEMADADLPQASLPDALAADAARADAFQAELARFAEASGRSVPDVALPAVTREVPAAPAFLEPDDMVAVHEAGEPGFMRQARRQAFWRSPVVRAALGLVAVALGLVLGAQWALHERDPLAARHPALAPWLARSCEPLGCEVGPVRRIDAVVIDSSTLVRRLGNFYAFDVVLRNTSDMPLAVPALELSLTDTRDSVIARRVFLPQELPGAPLALPARSTQALSLRLSIADGGGVSMAGYRALVFYP